jgi:hypothetical protein
MMTSLRIHTDQGRGHPQAKVRFRSGNDLVVGGAKNLTTVVASSHLYDPKTNTWIATKPAPIIAHFFKIAEDTVKKHVSSIFNKTGVSNRNELNNFAREHKLPLTDLYFEFKCEAGGDRGAMSN